jgi:serine/threonine-protein kinase 40
VLERCTAADPGSRNPELVNLQQYVIKEKRLCEQETLQIFYDVAKTVRRLHDRNIVHRDLKLGNLVLNKFTYRVTITNFCLGKHLLSDKDLLRDQRGSPAYISPDVLSGKPYCGKFFGFG